MKRALVFGLATLFLTMAGLTPATAQYCLMEMSATKSKTTLCNNKKFEQTSLKKPPCCSKGSCMYGQRVMLPSTDLGASLLQLSKTIKELPGFKRFLTTHFQESELFILKNGLHPSDGPPLFHYIQSVNSRKLAFLQILTI